MTAAPIVARPPSTALLGSGQRLAGAGGLVFVTSILIQNVVRASGPGFDASPATVTQYFADHRAAALLPLGLYPIGMIALLSFAAGMWTRTTELPTRFWATLGGSAVIVIAALFGIVNMIEIGIAASGSHLASTPGVVRALWAVHGAAFGLNLTAIAIALVGLSRVALATGLIPRALGLIALPGAACLVIPAVFATAISEGSSVLYLGFLVRGIFLAVTGVALLREPALR